MPEASVVVGHGGFGITQAALVAGVPQVAIPLFSSDQFANAAHRSGRRGHCSDRRRVGHSRGRRNSEPASVDGLAEAATSLLGDEDVRRASRALASEVLALPSAAECVEALTAAM